MNEHGFEYEVDNLRELARQGLIRWDDEGRVYLDGTNLPRFPADTVMECDVLRSALQQYRDNLVGSERYQVELRMHCDGEGDRSAQGGGSYWTMVRDLVVACGKLDMTPSQIARYADIPEMHARRFLRSPLYLEAMLLVRDHGMGVRQAAAQVGVDASHLSRRLAEDNVPIPPRSRIPDAVIERFDNIIAQDACEPKRAWQATQDLPGSQLFSYGNAKKRVSEMRKAGKLPPAGHSTWANYRDGIKSNNRKGRGDNVAAPATYGG